MTAQTIPFPRERKRGRKVTRGPCAKLIAFPTTLSGDELQQRWGWLLDKHSRWDCEETEGSYEDRRDYATALRLIKELAVRAGRVFDECSMRQDIERWVAEIESRVALKDRLDAMGASFDDLKTAETALRFLSNRTIGPDLLPSA